MVVHSCSLNLQHSRSGGFVEIGVLNEECSRAGQCGGRNLDGEVDDAESGGLLRDDGDVVGSGDGIAHAGVEAGLREEADVGGSGAGSGTRERNGISGEVAAVRGSVEDADGGDVEIEGGGGVVNAGGGGFDDGEVFAGDGGSGAGERYDIVGGAGSGDDERDDVGESAGRILNLDRDIARLRDVGARDRGGAGVGRVAGGDARAAGDEERGAGAGVRGNETAAINRERETVCAAGVNTGGV